MAQKFDLQYLVHVFLTGLFVYFKIQIKVMDDFIK